ncbi:hypothetical protein TNCV_905801 [Trichonephila clavipes]|nr:hypothetical protein TNCV_905801 [Trichonephila clavipes]
MEVSGSAFTLFPLLGRQDREGATSGILSFGADAFPRNLPVRLGCVHSNGTNAASRLVLHRGKSQGMHPPLLQWGELQTDRKMEESVEENEGPRPVKFLTAVQI